ncbi:MAG TPA: hypothetical protein VGN55_05600, partial [Xanthobacteraceae bacterium]
LGGELLAAPGGTPLVILFPPVFHASLPTDARERAELNACKRRIAELALANPHSGFLDYFVDSTITRDQENFQDLEHYRAPVARRIEHEIAEVLRRQGASKP